MYIRFKCDKCGTGVKAPDKRAGRAAKCPECKQLIIVPAIATMCKGCEAAFGRRILEAKRPTEIISIKLRQQYRCLECVREDELKSTLLSSISGLVLYVLGWWLIIVAPVLSFFILIISYLFLIYGCVSYAVYKGRSTAWGLILGFTIWPLMIFLHDVNKNRMNEIETRLDALYVPSA